MSPEAILAIMVSFAPPGQSIYSQVVSDTRACDEPASLLCAEPRPSPAWDGQLTRPETEAEALTRYRLIARLIHEVALAATWQPVDGCPPPRVQRWQDAPPACKEAHRARPWAGKPDDLERYTLTVTAHESGWRHDIHAGRGEASHGDAGRSRCLGQIMRTSRRWRSQRGYTWESLAGTDEAATRRCLETVADYLGSALAVCTSPYGPVATGPACVFAVYSGIRDANDKRVRQRVATFARFRSHRQSLPVAKTALSR